MKKLLAWVVVMVLCVTPLSAFAEGSALGTLATLSIGNVTFAMDGLEEKTIGATLNFLAGAAQDGRFVFGMNAVGGDAEIGELTLAGDAQKLIGYLKGMTSAYTVTVEELQSLAAQSMEAAGAAAAVPSDVDMDAVKGMVEGYMALMVEMSDPEKAAQMNSKELEKKIMAAMGLDPDAAPVSEEVSVLGETMTLPRFDVKLTMADIDAMYEIMAQENENFNKFWTNYKKMFAGSLGIDPEQFSFESLLSQSGVDMSIDMTVWADEENKWAKIDMTMNMTAEEDGEPVTMAIPYVIEAYEGDDGLYMTMDMNMSELGAAMQMRIDAPKTETGSAVNASLRLLSGDDEVAAISLEGVCETAADGAKNLNGVLTCTSEGEEYQVTLDSQYNKGEDGAESLNTALALNYAGIEAVSFTLNYAGTVVEDGQYFDRQGRVSLAISAMGQGISTSFDLGVKMEALTEESFAAIEALPQVAFSDLMSSEELSQTLIVEGQTALLGALGGLMQTPGIAEIIAEAMAQVEGGYEDYEGQYGDYGAEAEAAEPAEATQA